MIPITILQEFFHMKQISVYVYSIVVNFLEYFHLTALEALDLGNGEGDYNIADQHRCAPLLKQQSSITVYRLPTKEIKLPFSFAANKRKSAISKETEIAVFR